MDWLSRFWVSALDALSSSLHFEAVGLALIPISHQQSRNVDEETRLMAAIHCSRTTIHSLKTQNFAHRDGRCAGGKSPYSSAVFNAGKAASITTVVVNAPLMGRIAQVGKSHAPIWPLILMSTVVYTFCCGQIELLLLASISHSGLDRSVGTILGGLAGFFTVWLHYRFLHGPFEGLFLMPWRVLSLVILMWTLVLASL